MGFFTDTDIPPTMSFECPNNKSAKCQPEIINNLIDAEVQKGYLVGPFQTPPFSTFRVSPLGVADGTYSGKKRLIVDLSASHNNDTHTSLNELNKEDYSLTYPRYVKLYDAINGILERGRGSWLQD